MQQAAFGLQTKLNALSNHLPNEVVAYFCWLQEMLLLPESISSL
jgi:hypothetical protein